MEKKNSCLLHLIRKRKLGQTRNVITSFHRVFHYRKPPTNVIIDRFSCFLSVVCAAKHNPEWVSGKRKRKRTERGLKTSETMQSGNQISKIQYLKKSLVVLATCQIFKFVMRSTLENVIHKKYIYVNHLCLINSPGTRVCSIQNDDIIN